MPTPKPEPKYPGTQTELYAVCKLGWASYAENLAAFADFKNFYDAAYGTTALAEVHAAQALPDEQARGGTSESLRVALRQKANQAILKWKALREYIKEAYRGEYTKPQEEEAGYGYYDTATHEDWEDLEQMLISGASYITQHTADLTADGGMPAVFEASYNTVKGEFSALYLQFKDAQQDSPEGTDVKISANNAIYEKLMRMFDDAQVIFDGNAAKRDRFIYAKVSSLVTPAGGGGLSLLRTDTGSVAASEVKDIEALPAGTQQIKMTAVLNGPLEFGLGDGTAFNGNTTTIGAPAVTTYTLEDFASTGTRMMVRNQNAGAAGEYKVEYFG